MQALRCPFQFCPLRQPVQFLLLFLLIFLSAGGFRVGLSSFLLEGKIDGAVLSTRVLRPTPKETSLLFGNEINKTRCFLDSKSISAPCPSILTNSLFSNFEKATFSGNLENPMPEFCLCSSYEALPH